MGGWVGALVHSVAMALPAEWQWQSDIIALFWCCLPIFFFLFSTSTCFTPLPKRLCCCLTSCIVYSSSEKEVLPPPFSVSPTQEMFFPSFRYYTNQLWSWSCAEVSVIIVLLSLCFIHHLYYLSIQPPTHQSIHLSIYFIFLPPTTQHISSFAFLCAVCFLSHLSIPHFHFSSTLLIFPSLSLHPSTEAALTASLSGREEVLTSHHHHSSSIRWHTSPLSLQTNCWL